MADEGQEAAEQGVAEQGAVRITSVRMRVWSEEPQDMATLRQLARRAVEMSRAAEREGEDENDG